MVILDTEKVLVPNWFLKEHIELFLGYKISDKLFKQILIFYNDKTSTLADDISSTMREFLQNDIEGVKE